MSTKKYPERVTKALAAIGIDTDSPGPPQGRGGRTVLFQEGVNEEILRLSGVKHEGASSWDIADMVYILMKKRPIPYLVQRNWHPNKRSIYFPDTYAGPVDGTIRISAQDIKRIWTT